MQQDSYACLGGISQRLNLDSIALLIVGRLMWAGFGLHGMHNPTGLQVSTDSGMP